MRRLIGLSVVGQIANMGFTLALTWVYLPDELAHSATVLAVVLALASGLTFRADKSFALVTTKEQSRVVRISVVLHLVLAIVVLLGLGLSAPLRGQWPIVVLGGLAVAASSFSSVRVGRLLAAGDSDALAWRNLAVPLLTPLGQLSMSPTGGVGAIVGGFAGMYLGAAAMLRAKGREQKEWLQNEERRLNGLFSLAVSGAATPLAVLAPTFGLLAGGFPREAGLFTLALRIGGLPATATGPALGQAFVIKRKNGSLERRHWGLLGFAGGAWSMILIVGLSLGAGLILGDSWSGIGAVAVPAALVSFAKVLANPAQALLLATGRSNLMLGLDALRLGGCLALGAVAQWQDIAFGVTLWAMTVLLVATYFAYFVVSSKGR